jgi:5-methylcytosine-specific restriction protein A
VARKYGEHNKLYDGVLWRALRRRHLASKPLCEGCRRLGRGTAATVVHHKIAHNDDMDLFLDPDNLESLCASCHSGAEQVAVGVGYSQACGVDGWPTDSRHPNFRRVDK